MTKKLLSELIGTFFLVATVIGSGHMAENLFNDSPGNQLIANTSVSYTHLTLPTICSV